MRTSRTHYEVLGLPRDSTPAQIKRRYRLLVRKYHPDVAATDKDTATRLFLQIREAYEVLSDPSRRRTYDSGLDAQRQRQHSTTTQRTTGAPSPGRAATTSGRSAQAPASNQAAQRLKDAQWAFIQRRFQEAADHCKEVLKTDGRNARAYSILGDIYRAQSKPNSAIRYYSYALQYDPSDRETEKKLTKLIGKKVAPQPVRVEPVRAGPTTAMTINVIWWGIAFFLLMLIGVRPGEPIPGLGYYAPWVSRWSWNLVGLMAGSSAIVGMLLSVNRLLGHPDDELVLESTGSNWAVIPTGIILLIGSGFFFPGAAVFYIVAGFAQGSLSRSVLVAFAGVAGVVVLSALMYDPAARFQVLKFGGNVSFLSMLLGWYVGAMFKPLSDR